MRSTIIDRTPSTITFRVDDVPPASLRSDPAPRESDHADGRHDRGRSDSRAALRHDPGPCARGDGAARLLDTPLVLGRRVWQAIARASRPRERETPRRSERGSCRTRGRRSSVRSLPRALPENPWAAAFTAMAQLVRRCSRPEAIQALDVDFSTSGPVERRRPRSCSSTPSQCLRLPRRRCLCGIPWVRLEGTEATGGCRREARGARSLDLEWWVASLGPWSASSADLARGADAAFWRSIFQWRQEAAATRARSFAALDRPLRFPWCGRHPSAAQTRRHRGKEVAPGPSRRLRAGAVRPRPRGQAGRSAPRRPRRLRGPPRSDQDPRRSPAPGPLGPSVASRAR